jgi:hypothetical protein
MAGLSPISFSFESRPASRVVVMVESCWAISCCSNQRLTFSTTSSTLNGLAM